MPRLLDIAKIEHELEEAPKTYRLRVLREWLRSAPPAVFLPLFFKWFPSCDDVWPHNRWLREKLTRSGNIYKYMPSENKKLFDSLDAEQWVTRGARPEYKRGLSWTTSTDAADYFARLRSGRGKSGHVYTAMIEKRNIFAAFPTERGPTILLNNSQLYGLVRYEQEKLITGSRLSFMPGAYTHDDNNDSKTAELTLRKPTPGYWEGLRVVGGSAFNDRTAPLPPIENMSDRELPFAIAEAERELPLAKDRSEVLRIRKRLTKLLGERQARIDGKRAGRVKKGSWGAKGRSPGRPTNASQIVTLPVRAWPYASANDVDYDREDDAA